MDTAAAATLSRPDTAAYERHRLARAESAAVWDSLADLSAPDATYFHAFYGEFRGREAMRLHIRRIMEARPLERVATRLWAWTRSTVPERLHAANGRPGRSS